MNFERGTLYTNNKIILKFYKYMHIDKRSSNKILTDHEIKFQAYFAKSMKSKYFI